MATLSHFHSHNITSIIALEQLQGVSFGLFSMTGNYDKKGKTMFCFVKTLAKRFNCSIRTIQVHLKYLIDEGLIEKIIIKNAHTQYRLTEKGRKLPKRLSKKLIQDEIKRCQELSTKACSQPPVSEQKPCSKQHVNMRESCADENFSTEGKHISSPYINPSDKNPSGNNLSKERYEEEKENVRGVDKVQKESEFKRILEHNLGSVSRYFDRNSIAYAVDRLEEAGLRRAIELFEGIRKSIRGRFRSPSGVFVSAVKKVIREKELDEIRLHKHASNLTSHEMQILKNLAIVEVWQLQANSNEDGWQPIQETGWKFRAYYDVIEFVNKNTNCRKVISATSDSFYETLNETMDSILGIKNEGGPK